MSVRECKLTSQIGFPSQCDSIYDGRRFDLISSSSFLQSRLFELAGLDRFRCLELFLELIRRVDYRGQSKLVPPSSTRTSDGCIFSSLYFGPFTTHPEFGLLLDYLVDIDVIHPIALTTRAVLI